MKKLRKRLMSWLMVFAFVFSTFAPFMPMTVHAAGTLGVSMQDSITLDTAEEGHFDSSQKKGIVTIQNTGDTYLKAEVPFLTNFNLQMLASGDRIAPGGSLTFWILPKSTLTAGNYSEQLNIRFRESNEYGASLDRYIDKSIMINFTVIKKDLDMSITPDSYVFSNADEGYSSPEHKTFTITNTGDVVLNYGALDSSSFIISGLTGITKSPGESTTFSIYPKTGLPVGTYNEIITVEAIRQDDSSQRLTKDINLSFNVTAVGVEVVDMSITPSTVNFTTSQVGYNSNDLETSVTIKNIASITSDYKVDVSGLTNFVHTEGRNDDWLVSGDEVELKFKPKDGLPAGTYSETLTLNYNKNGDPTINGSKTFTLNFIVTDSTPTQHTVTFYDGSTELTSLTQQVNEGEKATRPATDPTKANHTFDDWYTDGSYTTKFDFTNTTITTATKIYAKFIPSSVTPVEHSIIVTDGAPDKTSALKNETITITADSAPSGKEFDKWVVEEGTITLADENNSVTTFTMPDENVKVKATYKDIAVTPTYVIESGANQTYTIDSNVDVVIKASGTKANLSKIQIDGTDLDTANYNTEEGSTILTLKASYLNTLSEGDHTVKFVYNDGDVSTNLKVVKNSSTGGNTGGNTDPSNPTDPSGTNTGGSTNTGTNTNNNTSSPQTSDNIVFYIMTMLLSLFGIAGASVYVNRKKLFNR